MEIDRFPIGDFGSFKMQVTRAGNATAALNLRENRLVVLNDFDTSEYFRYRLSSCNANCYDCVLDPYWWASPATFF